jgi:hypothetical protein
MHIYLKWLELAAAIIAVINWQKLKKHGLLKWLAVLIVFVVVAEFTGFFLKKLNRYNAGYYNFIVEPGLFFLYGFAFYNGYTKASNKSIAKWMGIIVIIAYFVSLFFIDYTKYLNIFGYNFGALYIATLAILMIAEIITLSESADYFKNPVTFLLITIFLYYLITIPHYSITYYYYFKKETNLATKFLKHLDIFPNFLLYISYSITFLLWGKKRQSY